MYQVHPDFKPYKPVSSEELIRIQNEPVLDLSGLDNPIIIEKIELIRTHRQWIVRTTSKDGMVGLGISNTRMPISYPMLTDLMAPYCIGKDARTLEKLIDEIYVYKSNYKLAGIPYYVALSAFETSTLDLLAKCRKVSLGGMFGPKIHDRVNVYAASGNRGNTAEEELEILKRRVDEIGAKAIKFKIGGRMSKNADSLEGRSEELIYLTRKYFGDDFIIHADGNGSYDAPEAIRYGKILEDINAYFYEEPCPFDDLEENRKVREALTIPIAFGEQETSLRRFRWLIERHAASVLQPDILYNGGLIRTTKVARMAAAADMTVTPHTSDQFCFVYILHFTSYTPNIGKYQEDKQGLALANELMDGVLTMKDGELNIPDVIGVGVREDHPWIKEAEVLASIS